MHQYNLRNNLIKRNLILDPIFIISLLILLLNDFYLKQKFSNLLTGKLSDFAGLIVFSIFVGYLFPKSKKWVSVATGILFIIWKTPLVSPVIEFLNQGFPFRIQRIVDYTDYWALLVLPFSHKIINQNIKKNFISSKNVLIMSKTSLIVLSIFAICATSMPLKQKKKYININKTYNFEFSRNLLIYKLNRLSIKNIYKQLEYPAIQFDSKNDILYRTNGDTLAILLDSKQIDDQDTIHYQTVLADFIIKGNDSTSSLTFINAYKFVPELSDNNYREKAIKEFERRVIKKVNKK